MEPTASFDGSPAANPNRAASAVCARVRHADRPDVAPIFYRTDATHPTRAAVAHGHDTRFGSSFESSSTPVLTATWQLHSSFNPQQARGYLADMLQSLSMWPRCPHNIDASSTANALQRSGLGVIFGSTAARLAPHRSEPPLSNPHFAAVHQFDSQWKSCSLWSGAAAMPDAGGPID